MKNQHIALSLCLSTVCFLFSGCATLKDKMLAVPNVLQLGHSKSESDEAGTSSSSEEIAYGKPVKMLTIWKDSVRTEMGAPKMRGFGGRIFLHDANGNPIRAKGELVVYGFDDSVKERNGSKADKKIVFDNSEFQARYSESGLGDSYSVWIDWDRPGSPDKSVTLIPFFKTEDGEIIQAGQAVYTLATQAKKKLDREVVQSGFASQRDDMLSSVRQAKFEESEKHRFDAQSASFEGQIGETENPRNSVKTTTIHVPNATQQRLKNASIFASKPQETKSETSANAPASRSTSFEWIKEARKKRREEMDDSRVFGRPGKP